MTSVTRNEPLISSPESKGPVLHRLLLPTARKTKYSGFFWENTDFSSFRVVKELKPTVNRRKKACSAQRSYGLVQRENVYRQDKT